MQDNFWTPELWCEFLNQRPLIGALETEMEEFLTSKSPKKEWEIVAVKSEKFNNEIRKLGEGAYFRDGYDDLLRGWQIHSVRRLSDASEWQVKEYVEVWETGRFTIQSFEISAGQMLVKTDGGTFLLSALIKLPILTTVDGVEIFDLDNFRPTVLFDDGSMNPNADERLWRNGVEVYNAKLFSSKEAAEKYVLNMISEKPLLSLNDVKKVFGEHEVYIFPAVLEEKLTALVKQKLNQ